MLLALSITIATMGLLRNSGAVVIAAMLIAPLMTPILGIAAAMVIGRIDRVLKLFFTVIFVALICVALVWVAMLITNFPRGISIPNEVYARTDPGIEDLVVALAAGVAGAFVQVNKSELSLLPGAAIGVSLVPPLSAAGILLSFGEFRDAYEACLLFFTNLNAIVLSACAVYISSGAIPSVLAKGKRWARFSASFAITIIFLAIVTFQLGHATVHRFQEARVEQELAWRVKAWANPISVEIIRLDVNPKSKTVDLWIIIDLPLGAQHEVASVADLIPKELAKESLLDELQKTLGKGFFVVIRYQTRIAGQAALGTAIITDAPDVDKINEEQ
ncbi:hypothetical protein ROA7450_03338 [Roseovarius albus]|uniref:TIGR00341 family protein n=2 Tax=Roseovarius albus TaxID=1247867 RepID=A0A1X6ZW98_9RHOB|nr:hypothetical protein ROA7450_03338 [Roseovarius albus]